MDRLRGRFEGVVRELERLGRQEAAPRPVAAPSRPMPARPRPVQAHPRPVSPLDREGQDAEPWSRTAGAAADAPVSPAAPLRTSETDLRAALGSRAALRRAFLLREILGPPVALRDPRGDERG